MGLMNMVNPDIPLYMGKASKEILKRLNNRTRKFPVELVERIRTFEAPQTIVIGDIAITPLFVDHSAYDAHMFLIEADGKRVLHFPFAMRLLLRLLRERIIILRSPSSSSR